MMIGYPVVYNLDGFPGMAYFSFSFFFLCKSTGHGARTCG